MEYASSVWDNCSVDLKDRLENVQYVAARIISGAKKGTLRARVYDEISLELPFNRRLRRKLMIFHGMVYNICPKHLYDLLPSRVCTRTDYPLRNACI